MKFFAENGVDHLELIPDGLGNVKLVVSIDGNTLPVTPLTGAENGLSVDATGAKAILGGAMIQDTTITTTASFGLKFDGGIKMANLPTGPSTAQPQALYLDANGHVTQAAITPSGAASGDLTGNFPAPTVATGAIGTAKLADGAVTDAKVTSVAFSKVTGTQNVLLATSNVAAGSDLTGTYGAPTIKNNAVTTAAIQAKAITTALINDAAVTTTQVADGAITGAKLDAATTVKSVNGQHGDVTVSTLSPVKQVVPSASVTVQLTDADSGKVLSPSTTVGGPVTYKLPATQTVGVYFEFVSANQNLTVDGGTTKMRLDNLVTSGTNTWASNTLNGYSIVACLYPGEWIILTFRGTWTLFGN